MKIFYLAKWYFNARLRNKKKPLQSVIFISDQCNLRCRHCTVYSKEKPVIKSFEQIRNDLIYCYQQGSRFVDFEGGEPFLWRDGEKNINNLVDLAKEIGFFSTTVTTNAQLPFSGCKADSIWVSMDGLHHFHDQIRGEGSFGKLEKNIADSGHNELNINMVINAFNYENVQDTIEYVRQHPHLKRISLNFHSPYAGTEELFLSWEKREDVIDNIMAMKKAGYPIMNSLSGLKLMKKNNFRHVCWISNFILPDGTRLNECAGKTQNICDRCGLCMAGEMHSVYYFKPDTILAGLKLRM